MQLNGYWQSFSANAAKGILTLEAMDKITGCFFVYEYLHLLQAMWNAGHQSLPKTVTIRGRGILLKQIQVCPHYQCPVLIVAASTLLTTFVSSLQRFLRHLPTPIEGTLSDVPEAQTHKARHDVYGSTRKIEEAMLVKGSSHEATSMEYSEGNLIQERKLTIPAHEITSWLTAGVWDDGNLSATDLARVGAWMFSSLGEYANEEQDAPVWMEMEEERGETEGAKTDDADLTAEEQLLQGYFDATSEASSMASRREDPFGFRQAYEAHQDAKVEMELERQRQRYAAQARSKTSTGIGHDGVPLPIYDEQEEDVGISEVDLDLEPEGLHEGDALGYKKKRKQNKQKHGKKQKLKAKNRAADHSRDPIARALLRR